MIPVALLAVAVAWGILSVFDLLTGGASQSVAFSAAAGWFFILAICFLGLHGIRDMAWTSVPVLMTFQALAGFLFVPLFGFAKGYETLDAAYSHAMLLVLIGFAAFWFGSLVLTREAGVPYSPRTNVTPGRVVFMSIALLVLGSIGNLLLWRGGLFAYAADEGARASSAGIVRWLDIMADMLGFSLIVSAVEVLGKRSTSRLIRVVFWTSLGFTLGLGFLSGMKSAPLRPLVYLVLIYGITRRRFPRTALLIPVVLFLFIYPFVNAFRNNLNSGYRAQFDSLGGLEQTVSQSFDDAFLSFGASSSSTRQQNLSETTTRLSYLTYVRDVITLPVPSMLSGDEKMWMAPFYPLFPRFLWKDKPVLDKGRRLSILLGRGRFTSSAVTPIGDLDAMYGPSGVILGMLVWGVCLQLYMNWIGGRNPTERGLFIYLLLLPSLTSLEVDYFSIIAGAIQQIVLISVVAFVVYGPLSLPRRAREPHLRKAQ